MDRKEYGRINFIKKFGYEPELALECGGRMEIIGNHTDHNHGLCLVANCSLSMVANIKKREDNIVKIFSEGYRLFEIDLNNLKLAKNEQHTSIAIIKGIANYFIQHNLKIGGFEAYVTSTIFTGAGVSSSAAFEVLIGAIFNRLYNEDKIPALFLAKCGQYSEREYFGKPCGLLDQIGVAFGGINYLDFMSPAEPIVKSLNWPFADLHIVLTYPGANHARLSHLYAQIPNDMFEVAHALNKEYLRDTTKGQFLSAATNKPTFEERAALRALHFYEENERVTKAFEAVKNNDEKTFLQMIRETQESSKVNLKNTMVEGGYETSPQRAVDESNKILKESAVRIHGGGFAGTIIGFIKTSELEMYLKTMKNIYGEENVHEVNIRSAGAKEL